jgi:hypothetical protein
MQLKGQSAIEYLTTYGWMLLVVAIVGAAVFSLIGERESKVDVSGFEDDDLQVTEFETANDGNLSVQVRHLDRETASIKSVNLSTDTGDKQLEVKGDKDVGSIDANNFQLCSKTGNITADSGTLEIVYDGQFNDLISEGEITGDINIQECKTSSSTGSSVFNVSINTSNSPVVAGDKLWIDALVNNTGKTDSKNVNLTIPSLNIDKTRTVQLNSHQNTTENFTITTNSNDNGTHTANITTKNNYETKNVEIQLSGVDDFADDSLEGWNINEQTVKRDGDAGYESVGGMRLKEGGEVTSYPGDGLSAYPYRGNKIEWYQRFSDTGHGGTLVIQIREQNTGENIGVRMSENLERNETLISYYNGSEVTFRDWDDNAGLNHGDWYKYVVALKSDESRLKVLDTNGNEKTSLKIDKSLPDEEKLGFFITYFTESGTGGADIDEVEIS